MRITVLGKSPSWQDADGACSGYLVEAEDACLLLDCGNGVFSKLRRFRDYVDVDAVVVSHLHADHILDLVPFASALTYAPRQQPVPVDGQPGTDDPARPILLRAVRRRRTRSAACAAAAGWTSSTSSAPSPCASTRRDDRFDLGALAVRFQPVPHFLPTYAVEVTRGRRAAHLRRGLLAQRGPQHVRRRHRPAADRGHAAAPGARGPARPPDAGRGRRARPRAGARRLVLTHISDELDASWARAEAERAFGGPVEIAREGAVYTL